MQLLFVLGNWRISGTNSQTDEQHPESVPRLSTLRMLGRELENNSSVICKKSTTKLIPARLWPGSLNVSCVLGCSSALLAQQQDPSAEAALAEMQSHCRSAFSSSTSAHCDALGCWQLELLGEALQELYSPTSCSSMINTKFRPRCPGTYKVSLENLQGWRP